MQIDGRKFSITLIVQLSYMRSNIEIIKSLTKENYKIESKKQQKMPWSYFDKNLSNSKDMLYKSRKEVFENIPMKTNNGKYMYLSLIISSL